MSFEYLKIFLSTRAAAFSTPATINRYHFDACPILEFICMLYAILEIHDDIERKRIRTNRAQLEDDGRFSASRGFSTSRQLPLPFHPFVFFSCTCYKLTLIPKPRPHSSVAREIPCAACVVTSTHAAHYLWHLHLAN